MLLLHFSLIKSILLIVLTEAAPRRLPASLEFAYTYQSTKTTNMNAKNFVCAVTLLFIFATSNAQSTQAAKKTKTQSGSQSGMLFLDGAWNSDDNKGFSVMHDGYFNSV